MLIYLAMVRPFEEDYLNDLEFFNECCTLGMAYFLILFTDWMPDVNIRWNSGFIMIALIGFNMLVNWAVIGSITFKGLKEKF